jgi:hypothetical protein
MEHFVDYWLTPLNLYCLHILGHVWICEAIILYDCQTITLHCITSLFYAQRSDTMQCSSLTNHIYLIMTPHGQNMLQHTSNTHQVVFNQQSLN